MKLITSLVVFISVTGVLTAQLTTKTKIEPVSAFIEATYMPQFAVGTNYINQATSLNGGAAVKAGYYFYDSFYVGGAYAVSGLDVKNTAIYGNASSATITASHLLLGYTYKLEERYSLHADAGYGWIDFRNTFIDLDNRDVFAIDSGTFINTSLSVDYKLTKDLGIVTGVAFQQQYMAINTAPALQALYNRSAFINAHLGIRFYIR